MAADNTTTTTSLKTIRKLGYTEHFSSSRHHLGIYRCVTISVRHYLSSLPQNTQINPSFFAALASIVKDQPILRVGITGEDSSNAHWTHIPQIDLRDHVSVELVPCETVQEYEDRIAEHQGWEHDQKWQNIETRSPWRITILRPSSNNESVLKEFGGQEDVFFSFHHSLMDGTGGREFHEMLLSALATHQDQDKDFSTVLSFPKPPSLPEPLEAAVNFSLSWRFMLGILWDHFGPRFLKPKPQPVWNAKPINFALPYKTRIKPIDISPRDSLRPLKRLQETFRHAHGASSLSRPNFTRQTPLLISRRITRLSLRHAHQPQAIPHPKARRPGQTICISPALPRQHLHPPILPQNRLRPARPQRRHQRPHLGKRRPSEKKISLPNLPSRPKTTSQPCSSSSATGSTSGAGGTARRAGNHGRLATLAC
ncbi:uncharacterized protein TrAtP1_000106 [Trichoderma atroviride]|uniref:uncharacterized protein n=1 Tax=Hypocrea atroviridis TaxID=63577 RepID=UPI003327C149|nr:hypothetical protein TrAtP1_000106 [Trichoderma atroviride]